MKGISPLLAAILLIAVTVSIATLVMGWVSTVVRGSQATVENRTTEAVNCASAGISIDDVYVTAGSSGTARVIVRNSGQADDLAIQSADIYNRTGDRFGSDGLTLTDFDRGEVATLSFSLVSTGSCPSDFVEAIVSTDCPGISAKFSSRPKCS